jgi:hypothetical protein
MGCGTCIPSLKAQDAHIQCIFMTGVSKFSKVSLFSDLNNLTDITISPRFATICGYTQAELETSFAEHLADVDLERFRQWYNGYQWLGEPVYNPFDVLLFLQEGKVYRNYWFETGSPSFLVRLFQQKRYFLPNLEDIEVGEEILNSFDVDTLTPETLLFQAGYLTIAESFTRRQRTLYRLRIPNMEVRLALSDALITGYTRIDAPKFSIQEELYQALRTDNFPALHGIIHRLFAAIPYRNFTNTDLLDSEGYYASVLYAFFASLDARIIPEDVTNKGQVDLTVILENRIFVMEIKLIQAAEVKGNPALEQIRARGYSEKYLGRPGMSVHELGLVFSKAERNLIALDPGAGNPGRTKDRAMGHYAHFTGYRGHDPHSHKSESGGQRHGPGPVYAHQAQPQGRNHHKRENAQAGREGPGRQGLRTFGPQGGLVIPGPDVAKMAAPGRSHQENRAQKENEHEEPLPSIDRSS